MKGIFRKAKTVLTPITPEFITGLMGDAKKDSIGRLVVGAIICNGDDKVLLLTRASGDFMPNIDELPSGKVEKDEELLVALKREIKEETSLDVSEVPFYIDQFDYSSKSGNKTRQFNFLVKVNQPASVTISEEHSAYAWVSQSESNKYKITDAILKCLSTFWESQAKESKEISKSMSFSGQ